MADDDKALVVQTGPLVMRGEMDSNQLRARVEDFVERIKLMDTVVDRLMLPSTEGEADGDYGVIPGTKKKRVLFQPGADKLNAFFGYAPSFEIVHRDLDKATWLYAVTFRCILTHKESGVRVGEGVGSATNRESKHYFRQGKHICLTCGKETVIHTNKKHGWFCIKDNGGCGAWVNDGTPEAKRLQDQDTEKTVNPDLADTINTIDKMAQKRAKVAAVLNVTGLTRKYTQDVEDGPRPHDDGQDDRTSSPPADDAPQGTQAAPKANGKAPSGFMAELEKVTPDMTASGRKAIVNEAGRELYGKKWVNAWADYPRTADGPLNAEQQAGLLATVEDRAKKGDK